MRSARLRPPATRNSKWRTSATQVSKLESSFQSLRFRMELPVCYLHFWVSFLIVSIQIQYCRGWTGISVQGAGKAYQLLYTLAYCTSHTIWRWHAIEGGAVYTTGWSIASTGHLASYVYLTSEEHRWGKDFRKCIWSNDIFQNIWPLHLVTFVGLSRLSRATLDNRQIFNRL